MLQSSSSSSSTQQSSSPPPPEDWKMINLARCWAPTSSCSSSDNPNRNYSFANRLELCRSAYVVHSLGLEQLVRQSLPMGNVPGDKMWHLSDQLTDKYSLVPRLVSQNRTRFGSLKNSLFVNDDRECHLEDEVPQSCPTTSNANNDDDNDGWVFCGLEGERCQDCPVGSMVRFGCGEHWSPLPEESPIRIGVNKKDATIGCNRKMFGDPFPDIIKICQCKPPQTVRTTTQTSNRIRRNNNIAVGVETTAQPPRPQISPPKSSSSSSSPPRIVITTYYGGSIGQAYREVTEVPLEMYARKHGYQFEPYDTSTLQYVHGRRTQDKPMTVEDHKFVKLDLLSHAMITMSQKKEHGSNDNTWIWWTDSDVLLDPYSKHSLEDLIQWYGTTPEGQDTHVILLRRRAVTSSSILVKKSQQGMDFLQAWKDWRNHGPDSGKGRFAKFGWKDQAVLNDMLFDDDDDGKQTIRSQWTSWRDHVQQVDCLCTDLGRECDDWFCEGIYPSNYKAATDFAIHAAGCDGKLTTARCVKELGVLAAQRAIGGGSSSSSSTSLSPAREMQQQQQQQREPIYGITITRRASEAARAARRFFRQTYETKKMIIVTDSKDVNAFQEALQPWIHNVNLVSFAEEKTPLGAQRQAGMDQVPMNAVYVQWDDDDIRSPSLLLYQYSELIRTPNAKVVTLASQVLLGVARNVSTVATRPTNNNNNNNNNKKDWHGIAGTIMGRRLPTTPSYDSTLNLTEDSRFLLDVLEQNEKRVHVWDNPPELYIRIYGRTDHASNYNQSIYTRLTKIRDNKWKVPTKMYGTVRNALQIAKHPIRELGRDELLENKAAASIGSSPSSWCVVLTSALSPHDDVDRLYQSSVKDRTRSYRRSLEYWNKQTIFPNVLLVDNSSNQTTAGDNNKKKNSGQAKAFRALQQGFPRVRMIHAPLNNTSGNKGMGERDSVFAALTAAASMTKCSNVLKVTGRFMPSAAELKKALDHCPSSTQLIVQRHRGGKYQPMESQLFGWPRHGIFEELYQRWNGEETDIEPYLFEIVKFVGQCGTGSDYDDTNDNDDAKDISQLADNNASCRDVCFVGPFSLPEPVIRGGSGKLVTVI